VTVPSPDKLQLQNALEDTYRPRYKSDYFPQNGNVRRPRYVADNTNNHCVTLQMPQNHTRDLTHEYIRIAWITTAIGDEGHFLSPYKLQVHNNDINVPDENPIYLPVKNLRQNDGTMRLHLVLIKSKLDQLHHVQPLRPFSDTANNSNKMSVEKMGPKDLINKYQLDKSQLAFTLCTKRSDGSYEIHRTTTTISSVMTEIPAKPSSATVKPAERRVKSETPATPPSVPNQTVRCPNCSHCFDSNETLVTTGVSKRKSSKGRGNTSSKSSSSRTGKRKNV